LRIFREPASGKLDYQLEYAYQFGRIRTGTSAAAPWQDVSAHTLHAELGYQFAGAWQPRLSAFYDFGSGDRAGGRYTRFDGLYGSRRGDWGPGGLYGPLGRSNIRSPGVRLEAKPGKRLDGFIAYRANWLDSATDSFASTGVRDPGGTAGRFAGRDVMLRLHIRRGKFDQGHLVIAMQSHGGPLDAAGVDAQARDDVARRALFTLAARDLRLHVEDGWLQARWQPHGFVFFPGPFIESKWREVLEAMRAVVTSLDQVS